VNERIRQLAEQAGDYVNEVWTPPVRSKTPGKIWEDGHIDWHTQFNEKFAELIVKECADICNKIYFERYPDAEDWERSEEGDAIKQHFGVDS